jgi:hypothetical protein
MQVVPFEAWIDESVAEVLESMCFTTLDDVAEPPEENGADWIHRRLEFGGPEKGSFGIRAPLSTARVIACNLLALEPDELTDVQASEAIGEIANMVCGAVLCRFETKQAFNLSQPKPDETALSKDQYDSRRVSRTFALEEGALIAWLEIEQGK